MLSTTLRALTTAQLKALLKQCGIPTDIEAIKQQFNLTVTFSKNDNGEQFATVDTRRQDSLWWQANKQKSVPHWRESNNQVYSYTDYSDCQERSLYMAALRAIKPDTCMALLSA